MNDTSNLPLYQSHKQVRAMRIAALIVRADGSATITPNEKNWPTFDTKPGWADRFKPTGADKGVFIQYEDGYESWSPTEPFEKGYRPLAEPHDPG